MVRCSFATCTAVILLAVARPSRAQQPFQIEETTVDAVHTAMRAGTLTCRRLVEGYLRRIDAYDKTGPAINAITVVNPDALATADSLDRRFAATKQFAGPLHCIPMIVKDNFQTVGLQTAAGNIALKGYAPSKDAFEVKRVKDAGAIVLAKSNMAEFAFSPVETVNSVLPGPTRSDGVASFFAEMAKNQGIAVEEMERRFIAEHRPTSLIRRLASVEEVANMVVYVCSPQASATTGAALRVDGGVVRAIP